MSLIKYIVRRLLIMVPIMFGVIFLSFVLTRMMPGNPYLFHLGHMTPSALAVYEENVRRLGLDKPVIEQFFIYIGVLFTGNWGNSISISQGMPVWSLIAEKFPRTLELTIFSVIFASAIGIKAGVASATNRNKWKDTAIRGMALVGVAVPVFWLGLLLQYLFGFTLRNMGLDILPVTGYATPGIASPPFITGVRVIDSLIAGIGGMFTGNFTMFKTLYDAILHLVLPVFCLSFITLAGITRQTRSSMLETLELDYIRTARAKGCKESDVINHHALRNALIPTITVIGMNFGALLGGAVLTEMTFNWQGMGMLMIRAITAVDYNVLNACVFLTTLLFIIVNLITDVIYALVDPRIRY